MSLPRIWYSVNEVDENDSTLEALREYTARDAMKLAASLSRVPSLEATTLIRIWKHVGDDNAIFAEYPVIR